MPVMRHFHARHRLGRRLVALVMLVVVLANLAAWGGGAVQMAHDLGHGAYAGQHASLQPAVMRAWAEAADDSAPAAVEHQALHAVDHMQFFPPTPAQVAVRQPAAGRATVFFLARALPPARSDLPFRPPRRGT